MKTPEENRPKVSIVMITYNHAHYVRKAIEGVLMQKVNFSYEFLIHDDASTDETANIIREYQKKYPQVIKPIYQTENQYSKGVDVEKYNYNRARGHYIALCEGDDYWIDEYKLQKQIDFLENNPTYIGVYHNVYVIDEYDHIIQDDSHIYPILPERKYTYSDAIVFKHPSQTSSGVYQNIFYMQNAELNSDYSGLKIPGDAKLPVLLTYYGDIFCLKDIMGCYRKNIHSGDSWTTKNINKNRCGIIYKEQYDLSQFMQKHFGNRPDNMELVIAIPIFALLRYLRHPNNENLEVLCMIHSYHSYTIDTIRLLLEKCIINPKGIFRNSANLFGIWRHNHLKFTI